MNILRKIEKNLWGTDVYAMHGPLGGCHHLNFAPATVYGYFPVRVNPVVTSIIPII